MRNRSGSRYLSLFALLAIGLIVLWRSHLLESARPVPHGGGSASATAAPGETTRDLDWDERQGGHTLHRHVGLDEAELGRRLQLEAGVAAASSFDDRPTAEAVIAATLARGSERIATWMRHDRENLVLDYRGEPGRTIGQVLRRGEPRARAAADARVVLRKRGARFFVLTAYPVEP